MSNKVNFDHKLNIIMLYSNERGLMEDKTSSITAIYYAYLYGNFTGYKVYFKNGKSHFFYSAENVDILDFKNEINIERYDIYLDNEFIDVTKVEAFSNNYYKITTKNKVIVTQQVKLIEASYKDILKYYKALAEYAYNISSEEEPLYFLAQNYQKAEFNKNSVLFDFFSSQVKVNNFKKLPIIVPFSFNQSQHKAIELALNHSISIIEGPPGTGKTQTILNLVSNLLTHNLNCAIVSNNNTAIENVYEKLDEEGFGFVVARLGKSTNVEAFFSENNDSKIETFLKNEIPAYKIDVKNIKALSLTMKKLQEVEVELAEIKNKVEQILKEYDQHQFINFNKLIIRSSLKKEVYQKFIRWLSNPNKLNLVQKFLFGYQLKISMKNVNLRDLLYTLEDAFYKISINEFKNIIDKNTKILEKENIQDISKKLQQASLDLLTFAMQKKYQNLDLVTFNKHTYKNNYGRFINQYPVVLSTSQSLVNNVPKGFMFDYLIIDEASQGDLLSSLLALSVSKHVVVIGDSKQLEQIDETRLFDKSIELANKYHIADAYKYESNSILKAVKNSIKDVPTTLLREHYRCAPDIINFSNWMFYNGELIPMTNNQGTHIEIIKTVEGNHARKNPFGSGLYNQREADTIKALIDENHHNSIGIITPFKHQVTTIKSTIKNDEIEVDTIHKFQGRQKQHIILSFVVNDLMKDPHQIEHRLFDFITNKQLLNVAISRGIDKVTFVISDEVYHSKGNIIHEFIKYAENLYGDTVTKTSKITSIFDYLYQQNNEYLKKTFLLKPKQFYTELLMLHVIEEVLKDYYKIGFNMHARLSKFILNIEIFSEEEKQYLRHPWTHVDFMFYNKISKEPLFVIEVDGIRYHEQNTAQINKDQIKDKALHINGIKVFRFKTNESNELERLKSIVKEYI